VYLSRDGSTVSCYNFTVRGISAASRRVNELKVSVVLEERQRPLPAEEGVLERLADALDEFFGSLAQNLLYVLLLILIAVAVILGCYCAKLYRRRCKALRERALPLPKPAKPPKLRKPPEVVWEKEKEEEREERKAMRAEEPAVSWEDEEEELEWLDCGKDL
jgi:hypothetical protein